MGYRSYISGTLHIAPALDGEEQAEIRRWLQREEVTGVMKGFEVGPEMAWFDNDASWRPGMDGEFSVQDFAAGIASFVEDMKRSGGSVTGGMVVNSEGFGDTDDIYRILVDDQGVTTLDGEAIEPLDFDELISDLPSP